MQQKNLAQHLFDLYYDNCEKDEAFNQHRYYESNVDYGLVKNTVNSLVEELGTETRIKIKNSKKCFCSIDCIFHPDYDRVKISLKTSYSIIAGYNNPEDFYASLYDSNFIKLVVFGDNNTIYYEKIANLYLCQLRSLFRFLAMILIT